jgi:hypothetical protein
VTSGITWLLVLGCAGRVTAARGRQRIVVSHQLLAAATPSEMPGLRSDM